MLLEVLQLLVDVRDDGVGTRGPVSRADLTVLVVELESLDETQNFFDVTANGGLVHSDLAQSLVLVVANNEQTSVNKHDQYGNPSTVPEPSQRNSVVKTFPNNNKILA